MLPHSKSKFSRRGFSLIELLIVVGLMAILGSLLAGVSAKTRDRTHAVRCLGNLRQVGLASLAYAADNEMRLPGASHNTGWSWSVILKPYASGNISFRCPADEHPTRTSTYAINDFLTSNPAGAPQLDFSRVGTIPVPSRTFLFAEAARTYTSSNHFHFSDYAGFPIPETVFSSQVAVKRHATAATYLFADGHAEKLPWSDVRTRLVDLHDPFVDPTRTTQ